MRSNVRSGGGIYFCESASLYAAGRKDPESEYSGGDTDTNTGVGGRTREYG